MGFWGGGLGGFGGGFGGGDGYFDGFGNYHNGNFHYYGPGTNRFTFNGGNEYVRGGYGGGYGGQRSIYDSEDYESGYAETLPGSPPPARQQARRQAPPPRTRNQGGRATPAAATRGFWGDYDDQIPGGRRVPEAEDPYEAARLDARNRNARHRRHRSDRAPAQPSQRYDDGGRDFGRGNSGLGFRHSGRYGYARNGGTWELEQDFWNDGGLSFDHHTDWRWGGLSGLRNSGNRGQQDSGRNRRGHREDDYEDQGRWRDGYVSYGTGRFGMF